MSSIGNACFALSESRGRIPEVPFYKVSLAPPLGGKSRLTSRDNRSSPPRPTASRSGLSAIRLVPYCKRTIRALRPLPLPDGFEYNYKYADRRFFERVKAELADDEEPLFVRHDGTITDTSFTNVLIETEAGYLTPTRPLLRGTQREGLLRAGLIAEADDLTLSTLRAKAKAILLINALLPLEEALRLPPEALQD